MGQPFFLRFDLILSLEGPLFFIIDLKGHFFLVGLCLICLKLIRPGQLLKSGCHLFNAQYYSIQKCFKVIQKNPFDTFSWARSKSLIHTLQSDVIVFLLTFFVHTFPHQIAGRQMLALTDNQQFQLINEMSQFFSPLFLCKLFST